MRDLRERRRGRQSVSLAKKMQEVCVQQVAISNYRIILILGFRGGWVNRRRDLRFHAYLRPTLELPSGSCGEGRGVGIIAATRSIYTRVLYNFRPLLSTVSLSLLFLFFFSHARGWRGIETAPDWFTRLSTEKTAILLLLFSFFSFLLLISLSSSTFRLKKFSVEQDVLISRK